MYYQHLNITPEKPYVIKTQQFKEMSLPTATEKIDFEFQNLLKHELKAL